MNCPICGAETEHETDYMDHTLMESHDKCPTGHWGRDFVTGSEAEWFKVDRRTAVDWIDETGGGVLCVSVEENSPFVNSKKLTPNEVDFYLNMAIRLYECQHERMID